MAMTDENSKITKHSRKQEKTSKKQQKKQHTAEADPGKLQTLESPVTDYTTVFAIFEEI